MSLGMRIAEKRKENKLSQDALGQQVGVTSAFISQIENGNRNPTYSLLLSICDILNTPIEYFVSGEFKEIEDQNTKLIALILNQLDVDKKKRVLDFTYSLAGSKRFGNYPLLESAKDYAQHLLKELNYSNPPVNPYQIADLLGVKIVTSRETIDNYEGILYKNSENPLIVLCPSINHEPRIRFTISMLLGNLIIPWHARSNFYREKNKSSSSDDDQLVIEAKEFANTLMVPPFMLRSDFKTFEPNLHNFEMIALKYGSSMQIIAQKYVQSHSKTSLLIFSNNKKLKNIFNVGFPYKLIDEIDIESFAGSYVDNIPDEKEIRSGIINASKWLQDAPASLKLYEESLFDPDPKFRITVTFLKILK